MSVADLARQIATNAHADQTRHGPDAEPYIRHPERVAAHFPHDPCLEAIAWLHDAVEDTDVTLEALAAAGLPPRVIEAVASLTHLPNEPNDIYWARVAANADALQVKAKDIDDNTATLHLLPADRARRLEAKYRAARVALGIR